MVTDCLLVAAVLLALYGRNKRWVPLDKAAYANPPNPFVQCAKNCSKNTKKCLIKTLLLPILLLAYLFQDRESARLVKEEEDKAKEKAAHDEKMEMQLQTRMKGGGSRSINAVNLDHVDLDDVDVEDVDLGVPGRSRRWLRVTATSVTDLSSSESDCSDSEDYDCAEAGLIVLRSGDEGEEMEMDLLGKYTCNPPVACDCWVNQLRHGFTNDELHASG